VANLVGVESLDAGSFGAPADGATQPVIVEPLASITQPEVRRFSEPVPVSQGEVAAECLNGGWPDGNDSACAAFASTDGDQRVGQVEILGLECDDFADSDAGFRA